MRPVTNKASEIYHNNIKYLQATKPSEDEIILNDMFWDKVLCNVSKEKGFMKVNNLNLKRKEITDDAIWIKYKYSLDKNNSTNDYLKIPQPQNGEQVSWKDIKNNQLLRTGLIKPNDTNRKYIKNVQQELRKIEENKSIPTGTILFKIVKNFVGYLTNGGKQMYVLKQDGWSFEDINENKFNLSEIPPNYGITSIIRSVFFATENKRNNYHQGITGVQNIIGSPFMSANLHTEHGNMQFATTAWTGKNYGFLLKKKKRSIE